jgi:hypothetical protein
MERATELKPHLISLIEKTLHEEANGKLPDSTELLEDIKEESCGFKWYIDPQKSYLPTLTSALNSEIPQLADLAATIRRLAGNPVFLSRISKGARERIADVGLWSHKIDRMMQLYRRVVANAKQQPSNVW